MRPSRLAVMLALFWLVCSSPSIAQSQSLSKANQQVEDAYRAYVNAWKNKDIAALRQLISDDYMAMNSENQVSNKPNELATAKADLDWTTMTVDEIRSRIFGNTAIVTGLTSAEGKRPDGSLLHARVRFLAALAKTHGRWQIVATESSPVRQPQPSPKSAR